MSKYAWIIDIDHMPDADAPVGTNCNASGMTGPSNAPAELLAVLAEGKGRRFRIYDDDGELYYSGRWVGPHWRENEGQWLPESAFGPLSDFGTPNAGATEIRYRANGDNTGDWQTL